MYVHERVERDHVHLQLAAGHNLHVLNQTLNARAHKFVMFHPILFSDETSKRFNYGRQMSHVGRQIAADRPL